MGSLKVQHKSLVDGQFSSLSAAKVGSVQRTLRNRMRLGRSVIGQPAYAAVGGRVLRDETECCFQARYQRETLLKPRFTAPAAGLIAFFLLSGRKTLAKQAGRAEAAWRISDLALF